MRLLMFPRWDKLSALLRTMTRQSAADYCQRNIVRVEPKGGRVQLADRSMNVLAVEGGETTIVMPDIELGKARDFMLRVTATSVYLPRGIGSRKTILASCVWVSSSSAFCIGRGFRFQWPLRFSSQKPSSGRVVSI